MANQEELVRLSEADAADTTRFGGKAATLARFTASGFRVPAGFIVTAAAMDELGDGLDSALQRAATQSGPGPFAVRSSAVAEDLADASYAGLYETFLNVAPGRLAGAVRRCFAAAHAPRVTAYHANRGPAELDAGMAVLVQQMIDPVAAGVAFTANPVTGARDECVVTAVPGLAEPLVSGDAIGQEWVVRGGEARCTRSDRDAIDAEQARAVAALAARVAAAARAPQDIEWAIDRQGILFLIQARAMTAVPAAVDWVAPGPGFWSRNFRIGEWLPEAMTPLFADWLLPELESGFLDGLWDTVRVQVPFRYATVNGWYYNALPTPSPRLLWKVLRDSHGRAPRFLYNVLFRVSRNPAAADRAVLHGLELQWRQRLLPEYRRVIAEGEAEIDTATRERTIAIVDTICRTAGRYLFSLAVVGGSAWKMEAALARFWRQHLAAPLAGTPYSLDEHQSLLRGLPGAEPTLPVHAIYSLDWFHPTAGESSDRTDQTVGSAGTARLATSRLATEAACRAALGAHAKLQSRFESLLDVAQRYAVIREEQARDLSLGWPLLRRCARRLGELSREAGTIDEVDEIFFVPLAAIVSGEDARDAARLGRAEWDLHRRLVAPLNLGRPPRLIGDPIARAVASARAGHSLAEGAIVGHPASAGRATGRVRIITDPADFDSFLPGEVLVTKATAPAWTPLFARAAAVVTDGGTLAAHASLVAREYGIPAVVGTGVATTLLRTGQLVTVDGGAGTVLPVSDAVAEG